MIRCREVAGDVGHCGTSSCEKGRTQWETEAARKTRTRVRSRRRASRTSRRRRSWTSSKPRNLREASASLKVYDVSGWLVRTVFGRECLRGLTRPLGRPTASKGKGKLPVCTLTSWLLHRPSSGCWGNAGSVERRSPWCVLGPPAPEAVMLEHSAAGTSSVGFGRNTRTKREP